MKTIIFAFLVAATMISGCTNTNKTRETLDNLGFKNIQVGGYAWFACGDDYTYATHFSATNPNGKLVRGAVCCGILKGCTAKF